MDYGNKTGKKKKPYWFDRGFPALPIPFPGSHPVRFFVFMEVKMDIKDYSIDELRKYLERLKKEKKKEGINNIHFLSDDKIISNFPETKIFLKENIDSIIRNGYPLKDFTQYSFETLVELFYGKDFFKWHNKYLL